jgi:excisionase family DNA binding protein
MAGIMQENQQLYSIGKVAVRWGISKDTVRRLIDSAELRSVTIAARRLIPLSEIERAELLGVGIARKKRSDAGEEQAR